MHIKNPDWSVQPALDTTLDTKMGENGSRMHWPDL